MHTHTHAIFKIIFAICLLVWGSLPIYLNPGFEVKSGASFYAKTN